MNRGEGSMGHVDTGAAKRDARGPRRTWPRTAGTGQALVRALGLVVLAMVLGAVLNADPATAAGQASWQVGRGVVQKTAGPPVLKLSLRNDGSPSKEPVRVLARWGYGTPGKRAFSTGDTGSMSELGLFSGEVALRKTAIIEVPLSALGTPPAGRAVLEIAVLTAGAVTDGQAIEY